MPVFGKGRSTGSKNQRQERRAEKLKPQLGKEIRRLIPGFPREIRKRQIYGFDRTPFNEVRKMYDNVFGPRGNLTAKNDFITRRYQEGGRPIVVLDWGCGAGTTIRELAREYGDKVHAYGFSKDSYNEWEHIDNAKLIQATMEDLPRYFKNDSVDLIYSKLGLDHVLGSKTSVDRVLTPLLAKLSPGGKLVFDVDWNPGLIEKIKTRFSTESRIEVSPFNGGVLQSRQRVCLTKK